MFIVKIYAASVEQVLSRGFNVSEGKEDYYLAQKKKKPGFGFSPNIFLLFVCVVGAVLCIFINFLCDS